MQFLACVKKWLGKTNEPAHLVRGRLGEVAAKRRLQKQGLKFLTANFKSKRGEIDLIFRDKDCLVFVEVKTRSSSSWTRPAKAVNARKRRLLSKTAFDYLRQIGSPPVKFRFDVVEVVVEADKILDIRHLPNTFALSPPYRYG